MKSIYRPSFDLDALRSFVAVVELEGFTAAANALAKTQSTVSHQIKKLEEQLGQTLLERTTRHIGLTPAGETFFQDARALLQLAERTEARFHASQISGEVRLGAPEEIACSLLPDVLVEFRREKPKIRIAVTVGVSGDLRRAVEAGSLDLAIIKQSPAPADALVIQPLCWAGWPSLAAKDPIPVAFFPEPCEFRSRALEALQKSGRDFEIIMTTTSYQSLYAVSSRGIAMTALAISDCPAGLFIDPQDLVEASLPILPTMGYTVQEKPGVQVAAMVLGRTISNALTFYFGAHRGKEPEK